jgi:predicted nucleotidyltransferase
MAKYLLNHKNSRLVAMKTKTKKRKGKPDPAILADIVKRVVEAAKPEKVVLFGSAARGTMGPDSDLDLLVIKGASSTAIASRPRSTAICPAR